jgi:hypothetical protein
VFKEPTAGQFNHLIQSPCLLKQVSGARDDRKLLFACQLLECRPVKLKNLLVITADD